jgi:hypothetical protein
MNFKKDNYLVVKNIISKEIADIAASYLYLKRKVFLHLKKNNIISPFDHTWGTLGDTQIDNTYALYGDVLMDTILEKIRPIIEFKTKLKLDPNYTYTRVYKKGDILHKHKDRFSCEISGTVNLGGDEWPIYLEPDSKKGILSKDKIYTPSDSKGIKIILKPGDMLIYKGCELEHWREEFKGEMCLQLFLHYNQKNSGGKLFDGREHLGIPNIH